MFCPFIKDSCVANCVFSSSSGTCGLLEAITEIRSNTGSDQTDSYYIDSKLGDISDKLDDIISKM